MPDRPPLHRLDESDSTTYTNRRTNRTTPDRNQGPSPARSITGKRRRSAHTKERLTTGPCESETRLGPTLPGVTPTLCESLSIRVSVSRNWKSCSSKAPATPASTWSRASLIAHDVLPKESFEAERREIADRWLPFAETLVHEADGRVLGFLALIGHEVGVIFVDPDAQGGGIGRSLMDAARELRPVPGTQCLRSELSGPRFYNAYGFEIVDRHLNKPTGEPELRLRLERHEPHVDHRPSSWHGARQ